MIYIYVKSLQASVSEMLIVNAYVSILGVYYFYITCKVY